MSTPLTPREHALKVAVIEALGAEVAREDKKARADAAEAFAPLRNSGQTQQEVLLPSGERIGLLSLKGGGSEIEWMSLAGPVDWARDHDPDAIEEYADPSILTRPDVLAVLKDKFPELVKERVRAQAVAEWEKELRQTGGFLLDKASGETVKAATVIPQRANGSFAFAGGGSPQRRARIMAEWREGRIPAAILGPLGIEGGRDE